MIKILFLFYFVALAQQETNVKFETTSREAVGKYREERLQESLKKNGSYIPQRQLVQDGIIDKLYPRVPTPKGKPRIIFTGGGMGVGKNRSIHALENAGYFNHADFVVIDPDEIKQAIPEFQKYFRKNPETAATLVHRESTYIADLMLDRALAEGKNIVVQGSLQDQKYFSELFDEIRRTYAHYEIEIVQVKTDLSIAKERANARALTEGRFVPEKQLEISFRRSEKSIQTLGEFADRVVVIENNTTPTIISLKNFQGKKSVFIPLSGEKVDLKGFLSSARSELNQTKHVVFDLDWTIINKGPKARLNYYPQVEVLGEKYFISPGAAESITKLVNSDNVKVSFYSGGEASRNLEVLKKIKLTDGSGRTLYDVAHKVLSKPSLVETGLPETAPFNERFQKDMLNIDKNIENIILVDDMKGFALQKTNELYLGKTYKIFDTYADVEKARLINPMDPYLPPSQSAWMADKYKMAGSYGIIEEALELSQQGKMSFRDAVTLLSSKPREQFIFKGLDKLGMKSLSEKLKTAHMARQETIKKLQRKFSIEGCL